MTIKKCLLFFLYFTLITGCNQSGYIRLETERVFNSLSTDDSVTIKDPDSRDDKNFDDTQVSSNPETLISGVCGNISIFDKSVFVSQKNEQFIGVGHEVHISEALNNVDVIGVSGSFTLESVINLNSARSISGNLIANAGNVGVIGSVSGVVCLKAETIQKIESISGPSKIAASSIEELKSLSGEIHIYKAAVKSLIGNSGKLCLHDGASIETDRKSVV